MPVLHMDRDAVRQYLNFYQDLGFDKLYVRQTRKDPIQPAIVVTPLPGLAPKNDTLLKILEDIGDCKRCRLHSGRNKIVFGVGNEQSKLVFVGEGPGADEDM